MRHWPRSVTIFSPNFFMFCVHSFYPRAAQIFPRCRWWWPKHFTETSAQEAAATWDNATLHVKDAEDPTALVEREALERVSRVEVENATMLASTRKDAEGLAWKVTLLEDNLATEHRALAASKREHRAHIEELTLLQTRGSELCQAIIGHPQAKHHLSEGMRLATLRHTEMVSELAVFRVVVSSATELVLGHSPGATAHAKVVGDLIAEFQKVDGQRS
jgi:hypothetical protein